MKGNRAVLTAVVVVVVLVTGWWLFRRASYDQAVDLLERFEEAEKRPDAALFSLEDATLHDDTRRAIAIAPADGTRIIWKMRVPDDGWLRVHMGIKPEAWDEEGNGVLFMVGISDGRAFDPLFTQHIDPFANQADRRWIPVMVDLSAYGGEDVDLIFNTFAGPPKTDEVDIRGDLALWGEPEIVVR